MVVVEPGVSVILLEAYRNDAFTLGPDFRILVLSELEAVPLGTDVSCGRTISQDTEIECEDASVPRTAMRKSQKRQKESAEESNVTKIYPWMAVECGERLGQCNDRGSTIDIPSAIGEDSYYHPNLETRCTTNGRVEWTGDTIE